VSGGCTRSLSADDAIDSSISDGLEIEAVIQALVDLFARRVPRKAWPGTHLERFVFRLPLKSLLSAVGVEELKRAVKNSYSTIQEFNQLGFSAIPRNQRPRHR